MRRKIAAIAAVCMLAVVFVTAAALYPAPAGGTSGGTSVSVSSGFRRAGSASTRYALAVNEESLAVEVTDTVTGRTVLKSDSVLPDSDEYDNGLNSLWERTAASAVTVYYTNENIYKPLTDFTDVQIELEETSDGFSARVRIGEIGLRFTLTVSLTDAGLTATIPDSSISETREARYPLVSINVYPFMNATRGVRDEGFILVPDGSGSIIDLTQKTLARNPYNARVFGDDLGTSGTTAMQQYGDTPPLTVGYPVFGLSEGGSGYLANILSGAEYSRITAYASGITTDYNFAYAGFIYRQSFYMPVDNHGTTVTRLQSTRNSFDATVRYTILEEATLGAMAAAYRDSLSARGLLPERLAAGSTPLKADFLMADNYDDSFGPKTVRATTPDFVASALNELKTAGAESILTGLIGYSKGGVTGAQPKHFPVGDSGSASDYRRLTAAAETLGVTIMPVTDYVKAYNEDYTKAGGHYSDRDLAMSLGKNILSLRDYKRSDAEGDDFVLLHPTASEKYLNADMSYLSDLGFSGIQFNTLGDSLNSSADNAVYTRSQTMEKYGQMAAQAMPVAIERPNEYLYKYADYFVNMPTYGSQYMIALESVPFLQMVLSGYTMMYRDYVNLRRDDSDIMTMIEYNVYPSYVFTEISAYDLHRTASSWIFSSRFADLKDDAVETYLAVNEVLGRVRGALFIGYEKRDDGLTLCTYDNGVTVVLNYGTQPAEVGGVTVAAGGYAAVEGV